MRRISLLVGALFVISGQGAKAAVTPAAVGHNILNMVAASSEVVRTGDVVRVTPQVLLPYPTCPSDRSAAHILRSGITVRCDAAASAQADTLTIYQLEPAVFPRVGARVLVCGDYFSAGGWRLFGPVIDLDDPRAFFMLRGAQLDAKAMGVTRPSEIRVDRSIVAANVGQRADRLSRSPLGQATHAALVQVQSATRTSNGAWDCKIASLQWIGVPGVRLPNRLILADAQHCTFEVSKGDTLAVPVDNVGRETLLLSGCPGLYQVRCGTVVGTQVDLKVVTASANPPLKLWRGFREGQ